MTPGTHNITVYRGARFSETLNLIANDGTETPLDLTGLGPFVAECRDRSRSPLIFAFTCTSVDLPNGEVGIAVEAVTTDAITLPLPHTSRWGLRDALGNYYVIGDCQLEGAIPEAP